MYIVVDFDGTCTTHSFPGVGKDIGAAPVLKALVEKGHKLILFTMRSDIENPISDDPSIILVSGPHLSDAIKWFEDNEIPLFGIQTNPSQKSWTSSPKAYGQIIIDDAALGCPLKKDLTLSDRDFVDWDAVKCLLIKQKIL